MKQPKTGSKAEWDKLRDEVDQTIIRAEGSEVPSPYFTHKSRNMGQMWRIWTPKLTNWPNMTHVKCCTANCTTSTLLSSYRAVTKMNQGWPWSLHVHGGLYRSWSSVYGSSLLYYLHFLLRPQPDPTALHTHRHLSPTSFSSPSVSVFPYVCIQSWQIW